jgi:N-acetylglucosamine-6-phosphate deacetylase
MDDVLLAHGVTSFRPTLITSPADVIAQGIAATRAAMERRPSVLGMHLEGPHLSLKKAGTHDQAQIRPMSDADLHTILSAVDAIRLLTFAPESVPLRLVEQLATTGMTLALGHTAASADDVLAAHASGAHMLTHLYNGMPPLAGRDPGPVGAAFASNTLAASIIADGFHVDETSVCAAARAMGERLMLTSDATASIEGGNAPFEFGGYRCRVENGVVRNDVGGLAGAAVLLDVVVQRMANMIGDKARAVRMGSELPARILGLDGELGRLEAGLRADINLLDPDDLGVLRTWRAGEEFDRTAA